MSDPDFAQFPFVPKGQAFEDFHPGRSFQHHWGRTLGVADNALFTTVTLAFTPLYFNAEYARAHGHPDVVVHPLLVLCTVVGLSVEDLSEAGGPSSASTRSSSSAPCTQATRSPRAAPCSPRANPRAVPPSASSPGGPRGRTSALKSSSATSGRTWSRAGALDEPRDRRRRARPRAVLQRREIGRA